MHEHYNVLHKLQLRTWNARNKNGIITCFSGVMAAVGDILDTSVEVLMVLVALIVDAPVNTGAFVTVLDMEGLICVVMGVAFAELDRDPTKMSTKQ